MSGASANASARRRRTAPNEPIQPNIREQPQVQTNNTNFLNERITPLELLKQHEEKLSNIENVIETNVELYVSKKINELKLDKKTEQEIGNVENQVNIKEIVKEELANHILEFTNQTKSMKENIDTLTTEFETLKMLLIKTQTLSLETNTEIMKMKDLQNIQEEKIEKMETIVNNESHETNINELNTNSRSIFEQLLMNNISNMNTNIMENDEDSDDNFSNIPDKIVIDESSNNENLDVTHILTSNNDIDNIKEDVISELNKNSQELTELTELTDLTDLNELTELIENK